MQKITPFLWFDNQAEEAAHYYATVFKNAKVTDVTPMVVSFEIEGLQFMALNGGPHFSFNEAVSFYVSCADQDEVDYFWDRLIGDGGEPSQCGWLKDRFGLSWQIIPEELPSLIGNPDPEKAQRAVQAMLKMSKIDLQALRDA